MRVFYGFIVLIAAALLWLVPITSGIYDFRTDIKDDSFYRTTPVATTNTTVTLTKDVYNNDTSTIVPFSNLNTDTPTFASYNVTSRATVITGLTANTSRTLQVSYDTDALGGSVSWDTFLDLFPKIWMIIIIAFPVVGLVAILTNRA